MFFCSNCGNSIAENITSCPKCGHPTNLSIPKKSQLKLILFCWFLGIIGAHRFYAGKTKTGILMILTLGGLGIWSLIDLIICLRGKFTDKNKEYIKDEKGHPILTVLITLYCIFVFISVSAAISTYGRYQKEARDIVALNASHDVALSEESYFLQYNHYSNDINDLVMNGGLFLDPNVKYSNIKLLNDKINQQPCFSFSVHHISPDSTIFDYNTCEEKFLTKRNP